MEGWQGGRVVVLQGDRVAVFKVIGLLGDNKERWKDSRVAWWQFGRVNCDSVAECDDCKVAGWQGGNLVKC